MGKREVTGEDWRTRSSKDMSRSSFFLYLRIIQLRLLLLMMGSRSINSRSGCCSDSTFCCSLDSLGTVGQLGFAKSWSMVNYENEFLYFVAAT